MWLGWNQQAEASSIGSFLNSHDCSQLQQMQDAVFRVERNKPVRHTACHHIGRNGVGALLSSGSTSVRCWCLCRVCAGACNYALNQAGARQGRQKSCSRRLATVRLLKEYAVVAEASTGRMATARLGANCAVSAASVVVVILLEAPVASRRSAKGKGLHKHSHPNDIGASRVRSSRSFTSIRCSASCCTVFCPANQFITATALLCTPSSCCCSGDACSLSTPSKSVARTCWKLSAGAQWASRAVCNGIALWQKHGLHMLHRTLFCQSSSRSSGFKLHRCRF